MAIDDELKFPGLIHQDKTLVLRHVTIKDEKILF